MSDLNIAVYSGAALGESQIVTNLAPTKQAGWTTVILGLFHIGYPPDWPEAKIFFNDTGVVDGGRYLADPGWPDNIAQLKQNSPITQIYASFGGGDPVQDFTTIHTIYKKNNNSFRGTSLQKNFEVFRQAFPAIDGIDMDCEDYYDTRKGKLNSFAAFCEMVIEMGFDITFCPYERPDFWVAMLKRLLVSYSNRVKWWNLQCYAGGEGNKPEQWASAIKKAIPWFPTKRFILVGDWNRFYDAERKRWRGRCPQMVKKHISPFKQQASFGGGFIWQMDAILNPDRDMAHSGCGSNEVGMKDYSEAIQ